MEQLKALGVKPRDPTTKSLAALMTKLAEANDARDKAQAEAETLVLVVEDLKKSSNRFAARISALDEKVKHLDNKVLDMLNDACAKELSLRRVTKSNDDYKSQTPSWQRN
jgi:chromosome segregation ATPase